MIVDLLILVIFIIGSALFSGLETGMISINAIRMEHLIRQKNTQAMVIQKFLDNPEYLLGTTLVGTNLCNVALSVSSASLLAVLGKWGSLVSLLVVTPVVLVFGEYLPKAWFQSNPEKRTLPFAPVARFFGILFWPVSKFVSGLAKVLIPTPKDRDGDQGLQLTRDELHNLTDAETGGMTAELSEQKSGMIQGVLKLSEKTARDVMLPIKDMACVRTTMSRDQLLRVARTSPHHRFPVIDAEGAFVGVLHILDWLDEANREKPITELMRPPQFVLESDLADLLLPRLQLTRQPLLLVRTKQAEVIGMITIQHILSVVVGE